MELFCSCCIAFASRLDAARAMSVMHAREWDSEYGSAMVHGSIRAYHISRPSGGTLDLSMKVVSYL